MIIDTSALIAILADEDEAAALATAIEDDPYRAMSSATYVEASIVMTARHGAEGLRALDELLRISDVQIEPLSHKQALIARDAWIHYGKGRHPAKLNYGDCFAYALARDTGEPLLFKGQDFPLTDIAPALA